MLEISYDIISVLDAVYLLSNHNGYLDADKKCLCIVGDKGDRFDK